MHLGWLACAYTYELGMRGHGTQCKSIPCKTIWFESMRQYAWIKSFWKYSSMHSIGKNRRKKMRVLAMPLVVDPWMSRLQRFSSKYISSRTSGKTSFKWRGSLSKIHISRYPAHAHKACIYIFYLYMYLFITLCSATCMWSHALHPSTADGTFSLLRDLGSKRGSDQNGWDLWTDWSVSIIIRPR